MKWDGLLLTGEAQAAQASQAGRYGPGRGESAGVPAIVCIISAGSAGPSAKAHHPAAAAAAAAT